MPFNWISPVVKPLPESRTNVNDGGKLGVSTQSGSLFVCLQLASRNFGAKRQHLTPPPGERPVDKFFKIPITRLLRQEVNMSAKPVQKTIPQMMSSTSSQKPKPDNREPDWVEPLKPFFEFLGLVADDSPSRRDPNKTPTKRTLYQMRCKCCPTPTEPIKGKWRDQFERHLRVRIIVMICYHPTRVWDRTCQALYIYFYFIFFRQKRTRERTHMISTWKACDSGRKERRDRPHLHHQSRHL